MQPTKSFRTKTGFCHILPEKILLTREGIVGNTAHVVAGKSIAKILIIYSLMAGGFFYFAYYSFINEGKIIALFLPCRGFGWLMALSAASITLPLPLSIEQILRKSFSKKLFRV